MATASGAVLVLNSAATLIPIPYWASYVRISNLGPNAIYLAALAADATTAKGTPIAATSGTVELFYTAGATIYALAATADQVSPADTRWFAAG